MARVEAGLQSRGTRRCGECSVVLDIYIVL